MLTAPSSNIIQFSPKTDTAPPTNNHTRNLFMWLDQVAADRKLSPAVFKVAYIISQHLNRQSGQSWPSTITIAAEAALAQSTVATSVHKLADRGHVELEPGKAGRGHSHRYRIKYRQADILPEWKTPDPRRENPQSTELKPPKSDMNHLEPLLTSKSAAPPRSSARVERENVTAVTIDPRERDYVALKGTEYLPPDQDRVCRMMFDKLLNDGFEPADLAESAATDFPGKTISTWLPAIYKQRYPNWRMPQS